MRARALHPDVLVLTSALLQVNCVVVRGAFASGPPGDALASEVPASEVPGQAGREEPLAVIDVPAGGEPRAEAETFVIDSPVLPEELELLPSVLAQAHFPPPSGLLATHADWDHVLAPLAFSGALLGCAESSARRLAAHPGEPQRELRSFDEELYLERPRPLALDPLQALPVPGHCEIGSLQLELHTTEGHTVDGMAILVPWAGVLITGDYISKIEIPMLNPSGDASAYVQTLERLGPLVASAEHIVPGHGPPLSRADAERVLSEDVEYLRALIERGSEAELPPGRRSREMRAVHARNAVKVAG